ncbi:hypothetical protein FQR65_LT05938 [Abscondita terminalis]|nr:hypothetical protein FQR65_LT05938 [Abscondita terminalis]
MVVVSGSWVKNVATYPTPANNDDIVIPTTNTMSAKAILICRPNSHPFQERTLTLDQPVKVGRSVARARATATNAIFDCKVLSRHHAVLWFDNGKFYLQDTKSSNGTFVNNNKLSSSDSEPHEVCSGDIVQFGVDVVENNRKVTHCCIVATLKLYLADGKEAKACPSITESNRHGLVPLDDLYKLNQIIQEACQREQCLENKLNALQQLVDDTQRSSDKSWQAYIGEERLLSRVATLENQLLQAGKNVTDDQIREELHKLQEEQTVYQSAAKEALLKLHREMLDAISLATEQEQAKKTAEQEAVLAKDQLEKVQQELQELAHKIMLDQQKLIDERAQIEQREHELKAQLETESQLVNELTEKLEQYKSLVSNPVKELLPLEELEKCSLIYADDTKMKEELLGENTEIDYNNGTSNIRSEPENNHINLRVGLVNDNTTSDIDTEAMGDNNIPVLRKQSDNGTVVPDTFSVQSNSEVENEKELRSDSELVKDEENDAQDDSSDDEKDDGEYVERKVESKTLKYQSLQNELKNQVDHLEAEVKDSKKRIAELEFALVEQKDLILDKQQECKLLTEELNNLKLKCTDNQSLSVSENASDLQTIYSDLCNGNSSTESIQEIISGEQTDQITTHLIDISFMDSEKILNLEEELVVLKERFSAVNAEKLSLNKDLSALKEEYKNLCNRSYNTLFFYVAPLVLMVLYLLISQHFS